MPRPFKCRRVKSPPLMRGYKPFGIKQCHKESITLSFEEFESIRLVTYENKSQHEASTLMQVSRPTITRIYNKAIKKIAEAIVEGKLIEIDGGEYVLDDDWFRCNKCYKLIQGIHNHIQCGNCSEFNNEELTNLNINKDEKNSGTINN